MIVFDHTNHVFSESSWHPLSTDPLSTHPSPTKTHHAHQELTQLTIFPLYDVQQYTNQIFYEIIMVMVMVKVTVMVTVTVTVVGDVGDVDPSPKNFRND